MATKAELAKYCADNFPHIVIPSITSHGVSTLTQFVIGGIASAVAFALGWYIKGRGMSGVQIDLNNIKTDVENLKAKVLPASTPVA